MLNNYKLLDNSAIYNGKYNENKLLGIEMDSNRKLGIICKCPICNADNYIRFQSSVLDHAGNKVISRISYTVCKECNVSFDISDIRKVNDFPIINTTKKFVVRTILRKAK